MKALPVVLLTLASVILATAAASDNAAEELDMREATFRHQFGKIASGPQESIGSYYLSITGQDGKPADPPAAFMKRFAGAKPPVKALSECNTLVDKGVVDQKTGERGLIFRTGAIKWISNTEAEVSGGYYEAVLSASGSTYYLKKIHGKWKVIKDVVHSMR